jgi:hypothetical protein
MSAYGMTSQLSVAPPVTDKIMSGIIAITENSLLSLSEKDDFLLHVTDIQ